MGHTYYENAINRNDISGTAETPGIARCNANQIVEVIFTTPVR